MLFVSNWKLFLYRDIAAAFINVFLRLEVMPTTFFRKE